MTQIPSLAATAICENDAVDQFLHSEEDEAQAERLLETQQNLARERLKPFWAPAQEIADMCDACVVRSRGSETFVERWTAQWTQLGQALQECALLPQLENAEMHAIANGCNSGAAQVVTRLCMLAANKPADLRVQVSAIVERLTSNEKTADNRFAALCTALWAYFRQLQRYVPGTEVLWECEVEAAFDPDRCTSPAELVRSALPRCRSTLDPLRSLSAAQIKNIAMFLLKDRLRWKATQIRDYWIGRNWPNLSSARKQKKLADDIPTYCARGRAAFDRLLAALSQT